MAWLVGIIGLFMLVDVFDNDFTTKKHYEAAIAVIFVLIGCLGRWLDRD